MKDLVRLSELWRDHFPERPRGGETALLGFRFEIIVALRDSIRAFLDRPVIEPSVFIEQVSDVCQRTPEDEIVFTQVKRTGKTVKTALEELWSIHTLASDKLPSLVPKIRYRIICSRWMLKDVSGAIDRWQPAGPSDHRRVESFKKRVSWTTDPNPFDELLALVANGLDADEPLPKVLSWIGRLCDPGNGPREVWSELHTLRNKQQSTARSRFHLWSSEDRPPETVEKGQFLISEQPKIIHLRYGYFVERPFYPTLTEDVIRWISSGPRERDPALRAPILWLGGRSGCGKSVALLHLLSRLNEEGLGPILWLGSGADLLPEAIRRVPGIAGPNDQVIISLDDPYAPRTQGDAEPWREAFAELDQLQNRTALRLPILVCCGPTDQARQLQEDFSDDVNIHTLILPHTLKDRPELESWFKRRTGAPPPEIGSGDVLVAQLFFEWRAGQPLSSFALRFRKRLEEEDPSANMRDTIYRIIAVNRIYAGYPTGAVNSKLGSKQRDAFDNLLREHHFAIDEDPGRPGVWLPHPHLANALFEAWLPSGTSSHQRQAVLKEAILDCLRYGETPRDQTAPLWAISQLTRAEESIRLRLEPEKLKVSLSEVYAAWLSASRDSLSFGHLPAWIVLRFAIPGIRLDPDPVSYAIDRLVPENRNNTGFRLTCHKLLQHWQHLSDSEQRVTLRRLVSMLAQTQEWQEWPHVAVDAVWRLDDIELRRLVADWVSAYQQRVPSALSWLLLRRDLGPNREWLLNLSVSWIEQNSADIGASPVLSALLKRHDLSQRKTQVTKVALEWVKQCSPSLLIERVLRRLLGLPMSPKGTARAVRLALDYLQHGELQPSSSFLLAAILRPRVLKIVEHSRVGQRGMTDLAIFLGMRWLELYPNDPSFPYVADRLLRLSEIHDANWLTVASRSISRLSQEPWTRELDYTLLSIARRRHVLPENEDKAFSTLLRSWLETAKKRFDRLLPRRKHTEAAKILASALPMVAHLGDTALQEEFHTKARRFRENTNEWLREQFDQEVSNLFTVQAWPDKSMALDALRKVGCIGGEKLLIDRLKELAATGGAESVLTLTETLCAALNEAGAALDAGNFNLAGFLIAKMLPVAARIDESYSFMVEALARRFISSPVPIDVCFGLMRECDQWIERKAWPSHKEAYRSLERAGIHTPTALEQLARTEGMVNRDIVSRVLDFSEELLEHIPVRAGLFLAPLLIMAERSGDTTLSLASQRVVLSFLESASVSEAYKARLAGRVKQLTSSTMPDSFRTTVDSLGLQAPWLVEEAQAEVTESAENLKRHLHQAEALIEKGFPGLAGMLLAPLLVLAVRTGQTELIEQVCKVTERMLEHRLLAHEERDGFTRACRSLPWPDPNVQDEVFQGLGIGAPHLYQLLMDNSPAVPDDLLQRSLDHTAKHLRAGRPGSAYLILVPALPLASWAADEGFLERTLELSRQLLSHPMTSLHLRKLFSYGCLRLLRDGRWRCSDIGRTCLSKIGVRIVQDLAPSDSPASDVRLEEPGET